MMLYPRTRAALPRCAGDLNKRLRRKKESLESSPSPFAMAPTGRAPAHASATLRRCSIASELSNFRVSPSPSSFSRSVRPSICRSFS